MDAFREVYENKVWGTGSGIGSSIEYAASTICHLRDVIQRHRIGLFIDAPCGDQQWVYILRRIFPHMRYVGVDVVPAIIMRNKRVFEEKNPMTEFFLLDLTEDQAFQTLWINSKLWREHEAAINSSQNPHAAIFSRHVLEHNSFDSIFKIYNNVRTSEAEFFIGTWQPWARENRDLDRNGGYRELDATKPPFSLPYPMLSWLDSFRAGNINDHIPLMALWMTHDVPIFDSVK